MWEDHANRLYVLSNGSALNLTGILIEQFSQAMRSEAFSAARIQTHTKRVTTNRERALEFYNKVIYLAD